MNKKVVVMSGSDVAAMRKAHKEAEKAYFEAKVGALEYAVEEMKSSGKDYALHELTAMTGLSPMEIIVQLNGGCRAAQRAGVYNEDLRSGIRHTERKFVEVMENGEVNPNSVMTISRSERCYRILPRERRR